MVLGEEAPPEFGDNHPAADRVLRLASAIGAVVLVVLTAILVAPQDTESERRPTVVGSPAPSASSTPGPTPRLIGPARPASFRGASSLVVGPVTFVPARYQVRWTARATRGRCYFALAVASAAASPAPLAPVAEAPIGTTVAGSTETTLTGMPHELHVTGLHCRWRITVSWSRLAPEPPSGPERPAQ